MSTGSKAIFAVYLIFLGFRLCLWWYHLPDYTDAVLYTYPDMALNRSIFHHGFIPLWNPYIGCGTPQLPYWHSTCLYPFFWVFNVTGITNGFMTISIVHKALIFLGMFLWLKRLKVDPLPSALGALAFACSGHISRCSTNLPFLATAAWIPWIFWGAHRALEKRSFMGWLVLGLLVALQALGGYPFFLFYATLFLLVWFEWQRPTGRDRLALYGTLAGAALFTCLQWLPFLEMLTFSVHDSWQDYPYFTKPIEFLTLLSPDILGRVGTTAYRGSFANANFNLYIGLIPLALWVGGLWFFRRGGKGGRFWVIAAFIWILWLAGERFPLWRILPEKILLTLEPSKAVGLFAFCAVTAAALVLHHWGKRVGWNPGRAWVLSLLFLADFLTVPFRLLHPLPNPYQNPTIREIGDQIRQISHGRRFLSVHLASELADQGPGALSRMIENPVKLYLANCNAYWKIRSPDRYLYLQTRGSENLMRYINKGFPYEGDLLDIAGTGFFLVSQPLKPAKYRTLGLIQGDWLVQNTQASSDVRWVGEKTVLADRPSVLNRLARSGSGWRQRVYLDQGPDGNPTHLEGLSRQREKIIKEDGREVGSRKSFTGAWPQPGFVVFNETYTPGWHAWVDGKGVPILRAYGLFMGVAVEAGNHQVEFRYEPASFRLGLFLSLAIFIFGIGKAGHVRRF